MDIHSEKILNQQLDRAIRNLRLHQFETSILEKKEHVIPFLEAQIEQGSSVAVGGSMTLAECGVIDWLRTEHVSFIDRYQPGIDVNEAFRRGLSADVFLMSSNAVTLEGELVNTDGTGNRVSALIFGPKKVFVVVGINKLVFTREEAQERIRQKAAPMNCERLNRDTPCRLVGECVDCNVAQRICSANVVLSRSHISGRIHIVFVKEPLGY
ncbi:MAG: lactate utilization protein [Erysipelotrichaceae bacterium]